MGWKPPWVKLGQAKLLGILIHINPFIALQSKSGESWKEVMMMVQGKGFCQNWEPEMLKNKVSSLLERVKVHNHFLWGKKKRAPLLCGREFNSDPPGFAVLSGKLDAIQHLKLQVKEIREDQKEHAKETQNQLWAAGEILHGPMMHGHKHMTPKRTHPSTTLSDGGAQEKPHLWTV
ncbi:hypothetical protein JB92DRAFT_3103679 [Gautieria morchelliformis]|nr:hypothetical protein JB92DRAFT_3103679 [Gautieria morchelliformis]